MGLLSKLRGRPETTEQPVALEAPPCPHVALLPHWDSLDDMGHEDKAVYFYCDSCGQQFSPDEARALRDTEAERIRDIAATEEPVEETAN
jgi:hypothetical protein